MEDAKIKRDYKILIYIVLIIGILVYTFLYGIQKDMHHAVPGPIGHHVQAIGLAISDLEHGLKGYRGYYKIYNTLMKYYGMTNQNEALTNPLLLNNALTAALDIDKAELEAELVDEYSMLREDKGIAVYYKLAFKIFGYKIEGFFYLYFLLLAISVFIFLVTFFQRLDLLNFLLLFVASHLMIVACAPVVGLQLQTVHNDRFLPVLGVLPALYLALLILGKKRLTTVTLIGACIQVIILMLVIHIRIGTAYQILFLSAVFGLAVLWYWRRNPLLGRCVFNKIHLWPLVLVFLGVFILKAHLAYSLYPSYTKCTTHHFFWHPTYLGLAAHPDSMRKYGIRTFYDDILPATLIHKHASQRYGRQISPEELLGNEELYERLLKEEFFGILKRDPRFVVESYLYKLPLFVKTYFSSSFGAIFYLFKWGIVAIVVIGSLLAGKVFLKQWFFYFCLLLLCLAFSLIPTIIAIPGPHLIADPALIFTFVVYMLLSGVTCFIVKRCVWHRKGREQKTI